MLVNLSFDRWGFHAAKWLLSMLLAFPVPKLWQTKPVQSVGRRSTKCHRKFWGCGKLRFLLSLAIGAIEQDRVALELPNRR